MSAPTHALSRKVLSLTKPKDKIYKTKNDDLKKILLQLYNNNAAETTKNIYCVKSEGIVDHTTVTR